MYYWHICHFHRKIKTEINNNNNNKSTVTSWIYQAKFSQAFPPLLLVLLLQTSKNSHLTHLEEMKEKGMQQGEAKPATIVTASANGG